jgi:hypothetical protein
MGELFAFSRGVLGKEIGVGGLVGDKEEDEFCGKRICWETGC